MLCEQRHPYLGFLQVPRRRIVYVL
jgi:hypothetical protein